MSAPDHDDHDDGQRDQPPASPSTPTLAHHGHSISQAPVIRPRGWRRSTARRCNGLRWYRNRWLEPASSGRAWSRNPRAVPLASPRVIHDHPDGSRAGGSGCRDPDPVVHPLPVVGNRIDDRPQPGPAPRRVRQGPATRRHAHADDPAQPAAPTTHPSPEPRRPYRPLRPSAAPVGTITIPKIDLSMVVVEGTGDAQLQTGPGHYPGTPAARRGRQFGHRRPPHHLPPPLLQPQRAGPGRLDHRRHAAGDLPLPRDREPGRPPDRRVGGGRHQETHPDADHLQPRATAPASGWWCTRRWWPASWPTTRPVRPRPCRWRLSPLCATRSATPAHDWTAAILWGIAVAALTTIVWVWDRRLHRGRRVAVVACRPGGLAGGGVLLLRGPGPAPAGELLSRAR